jgi:hypothetical protein
MVNVNRDQLNRSARTKMEAAKALVSGRQSHPTPAVYLSHVALECALKRRILIINKAAHVNDLKRYLRQDDFDKLFSGTTGHNLQRLEGTAGLRRYLTALGDEHILAHRAWRNMGRERPYSLRYGFETVALHNAKDEVQFAGRLVDLILQEAT